MLCFSRRTGDERRRKEAAATLEAQACVQELTTVYKPLSKFLDKETGGDFEADGRQKIR